LLHLQWLTSELIKWEQNINDAMQEDPDRPDIYGYDWYYMTLTVRKKSSLQKVCCQKWITKVETRLIEKVTNRPSMILLSTLLKVIVLKNYQNLR
jgi:hypothetical protein